MKQSKSIVASLFLFFFVSVVSAQTSSDTTKSEVDSTQILFFYGSIDSLSLDKFHSIDTSLIDIQEYDPIRKNNGFYENLGNLGLPAKNIIFSPQLSPGFNYGKNTSDPYLYLSEKMRYYKVYVPYTRLKYVMGGKKEQYFRVTHSQNISPNINMGIDFRFIYSPGLYKRQKSDDKNLFMYGQYLSPNKRYGIIFNYIHNKNIVQENGGITTDSLFTGNIETDRQLYKINLENAENTIKHAGIFLNQYFYLSKAHEISNDTLDTIPNKIRKFHLGQLSHSLHWTRDKFSFTDSDFDTTYYKQFDPYLDTNNTFDSVYVTKLVNTLKWSNLGHEDQPEDKAVYVHFGIKHQLIEVGDTSKSEKFQQLIPTGGFSVFILKSFRLNFELNFVLGDYNGGDFNAHAQIKQFLGTRDKNLGLLTLDAKYIKSMPDWFFQNYTSNHFRWENNFSQQEFIIGGVNYRYKNLRVGVRLNQLKNYVYLDSSAHPRQFGPSFSVFQLFLEKSFKFGKFGLETYAAFQQTSKKEIVHIPDFLGRINFHFTQSLFKNATTIQPGFAVRYNTSYYADSYMPVYRQFYLQDETKIGNFFIADVYLNVKIKRTRFFLKYAHINAGWMGYEYFGAPHYPMRDAAFKFGLSWMFYD